MAAVALAFTLAGCGGGGGTGSGTSGGTGGSGTTLVSITVTPVNPIIKVGATQQLKATGTYVNNTTSSITYADITSSVTWGSSANNVATVNASGLASGVSVGTTAITATSGLIYGSTTLSVTDWTTRLSAPRSTIPLGGIAFDGKNYVTVQDAISYSSNLLVWNEQDSIASFNDVVWNGSSVSPLFVAAGFFGFEYSTDGIAWTADSYWTGSNTPSRLAYSRTLPLWVAVGSSGYVYTSKDGITWTSATPTTADLYSVAWTGTQFVAVGGAGTILTSPDGVTWTTRTSNTTHNFSAVGANSSLVVACTDSGSAATGSNGIYTSPDGINWTYSGSTITNCSSIINAGGQWVTVGFDFAATSPNGTTWTTTISTVGQLSSVIHDGTQYVAAGGTIWSNPAIYTSPDGSSWTLKTSYESNISIARSTATGLLVAVTQTDRSLASTDNGATWQYGGINATTTGNFFLSVAWSPALNEFIAANGSGDYSSTDGLNWTLLGTGSCYGKIEASPTLLVNACSGSGSVLTSTDGKTWSTPTYPSTQGVNDVFWTGTQFVALGSSGDIVTSPSGTTWTLQTSGTTNSLYGFAASPSLMVAVGYNGTIITSSNGGVTWTPQTSGTTMALNRVVWTGVQFIAIGASGTVLSSTNGTNWVAQPTPYTNTLFASDPFNLNDIVQAGTSLVMVGTRGLVATLP